MLFLIPEACQYVSFEATVHTEVRPAKVFMVFRVVNSSVAGQIWCTDVSGTNSVQQDTGQFLGKVNQ
jgi:hypothetical protein